MVSFQCDGCSDVVKKPKLDQHRGKCNSTFTCIDCFTTFNGPSEYKGHTSCITEAEKYQKSLYKGPKNGKQNGASKGDSEPKEQSDSKPTPESKPAPSMNTIHPSRSQTGISQRQHQRFPSLMER
ncbi:hypothetical protein QCA50_004013 [Cerrena zonata]|uniref:Zinc finger C2H2 LYAR-type domain-containing protein n=1 Tax=Cerrena zonata TaxID=2478898 RepID=A0AAW0GQ81_9APHY